MDEKIKQQLNQARKHYDDGEEGKAIELMNIVLAEHPKSLDVHLEAGKILFKIGNIADHNRVINRAIQIDKNNYRLNAYLASRMIEDGKVDKALEYAKKALKAEPDNIIAYEALASIYERMAKIDKVQELVDEVKVKFKGEQYLYTEVKILMNRKEYDAAIEFIKTYIEKHKVTKSNHCRILMDMGACLDKIGEYDKAYKVVIEGKKIKRDLQKSKRKEGNYKKIIAEYTEFFSNNNEFKLQPSKIKKEAAEPIFIVGFPRSGTTLVEQVLYSSGKVFAIDETKFMTSIINRKTYANQPKESYLSPEHLLQISASKADMKANRKFYFKQIEQQFGEAVKGKRILDKMPANTSLIPVIKTIFPNAKIVMPIRDARDSIVSCLFQNFARDNFHDFDEATQMYDNVMNLYMKYRKVFKKDILEIRYEDLLGDFENKARELYNFVGEKWTDDVLKFHKKKREVTNKTPNRYAINQPLYKTSVAKWRNYETHLKPYLPKLEKYLTEFGYEV